MHVHGIVSPMKGCQVIMNPSVLHVHIYMSIIYYRNFQINTIKANIIMYNNNIYTKLS